MLMQFSIMKFLELANAIVAVVLLFKIVGSYIIYGRQKETIVNRSFWFYIFFAICYTLFSILQCYVVFVLKNPESYTEFQKTFVIFARDGLYIGAYMYLQIYCYKLVTTNEIANVYCTTTKKDLKQKRFIECSIYISCLTILLLQVLSAALQLLWIYNYSGTVCTISTICTVISLIELYILYQGASNCKKLLRSWICFAVCGILVVPCSSILETLVDISTQGIVDCAKLIVVTSLLLVSLRVSQLAVAIHTVFRHSDVRFLYD